jgi:hypothetical protein
MQTYQVIAERIVLEVMEVEAESKKQALKKAGEADNSEWSIWVNEPREIKCANKVY